MTTPDTLAKLAAPSLDLTLNEEQAKFLRDMLGDDPDEATRLRLIVGEGHSGHGLYVAEAECQEEGANLIAETPRALTAQALPATEPVAWKWRNKSTGACGCYFEDPSAFIPLDHPDYEWTLLYSAPQSAQQAAQAPAVTCGNGCACAVQCGDTYAHHGKPAPASVPSADLPANWVQLLETACKEFDHCAGRADDTEAAFDSLATMRTIIDMLKQSQ